MVKKFKCKESFAAGVGFASAWVMRVGLGAGQHEGAQRLCEVIEKESVKAYASGEIVFEDDHKKD